MSVKRFGVSLEEEQLTRLDEFVLMENFPNRSRAISHLLQKQFVENKWNNNEVVIGALLIVYDHTKKELHSEIAALQHEYNCLVISGQHVHIDSENCLEVITLKGIASKLQKLSRKYKGIKGMKSVELVMSGVSI